MKSIRAYSKPDLVGFGSRSMAAIKMPTFAKVSGHHQIVLLVLGSFGIESMDTHLPSLRDLCYVDGGWVKITKAALNTFVLMRCFDAL